MINQAAFSAEEYIRRIRDDIFLMRLDHAILVEGESDKPFWDELWKQVIPDRYYIYSNVHYPAPNTAGKTALIKHYISHASRDFLICLDSDFDYLLEPPPLPDFVFQTYVHSVESYLCYAPSLPALLIKGVQSEDALFDFEQFFLQYSSLSYQWLSSQLYQHTRNGTPIETSPSFKSITEPEQDLQKLSEQSGIAHQFDSLQGKPDFQRFEQGLNERGLAADNAYLFIRGHDLMERIVLKLLKCVAQPIIKQQFDLRDTAGKGTYQQYQRQNTFEKLLRENRGYQDCPFYLKILTEARRLLS